MKDILINYPIKILQQELINIRSSYRLEKKRIIEILKDMKSIKKLTKEELIDLLIKYNYDISKLPKLEDLIKPKKERKPRAKKELLKRKEELLKLKLEEERKEFKKNKLFDIDDEQSLNIYIALKKNNIGYDKEILDKLINNNKLIIELKKDILKETNYNNFLNLKNKIEELYKEINEYELILDKQSKEIEKKRNEEPKFMIKKNKVSPDDYIKMKDDFKSNTYEWVKQAYKQGLTDTEILSYSGTGEKDYKLLNAFFTPDKIINDMFDLSFLYENLTQKKNYNDKKPLYILECSGGIGNIIYYILETINNNNPDLLKYIKIDFVEINKEFIEIARAKLDKYKDIITYHNMSFFNFKTDNEYDYIFGNPPYKLTINNKNIYDVDFFLKCWDLLSYKIAFLMSPTSITGNTKSHKLFKDIIEDYGISKKIIRDEDYGNQFRVYKNKEFKDKKTTQAGLTSVDTYLYVLEKK